MARQEGTRSIPGHQEETSQCQKIGRMLAQISDKWTMLVVRTLGPGPKRFNALKREIGDISQKMLSSTLRDLEKHGFVSRTVTPSIPVQVEYALTELGRDFLKPVGNLANWVLSNSERIEAAQTTFEKKRAKG